MLTHLVIDPGLLERVVQVSGENTERAAVITALREFIARREQRQVADLLGKLEWDASFDYKAERSGLTIDEREVSLLEAMDSLPSSAESGDFEIEPIDVQLRTEI